jgi:hypothetical protein
MDKTTFAAICIGTAGTLEGIALICGRDGVYLAALTGFMGIVAGYVFGIITGKATKPPE